MPLFTDSNGLPVKFFLQRDLSEDIKVELTSTITSLGGRVDTKVPIQGYILTQPGTHEAERLLHCWSDPLTRPERYFVPYTYVDACKTEDKLLKQIFIEKGVPLPIHIHASISSTNARTALEHRILHSGGEVTINAQQAFVILADPNTDIFKSLVKKYNGTNKHIESHLWVQECLERGAVVYTPLVYKNPGGRRPGEDRTAFTVEDEENLCKWIAFKIPFKNKGGRTGNRIYQKLCELVNEDSEYTWAARHTWQSWRERYKKNAERLDQRINTIVKEQNLQPGETGQWGYVRQTDEIPKKTRKKRPRTTQTPEPDSQVQAEGSAAELAQNHQIVSPEISTTEDKQSGEDEDDGEWAVRIGHDPPPRWAKDAVGEDGGETRGKRRRLISQKTIDETIKDIATKFRFTVQEVQEYYTSIGDLTKTRSRFQRMRITLSQFED